MFPTCFHIHTQISVTNLWSLQEVRHLVILTVYYLISGRCCTNTLTFPLSCSMASSSIFPYLVIRCLPLACRISRSVKRLTTVPIDASTLAIRTIDPSTPPSLSRLFVVKPKNYLAKSGATTFQSSSRYSSLLSPSLSNSCCLCGHYDSTSPPLTPLALSHSVSSHLLHEDLLYTSASPVIRGTISQAP